MAGSVPNQLQARCRLGCVEGKHRVQVLPGSKGSERNGSPRGDGGRPILGLDSKIMWSEDARLTAAVLDLEFHLEGTWPDVGVRAGGSLDTLVLHAPLPYPHRGLHGEPEAVRVARTLINN